MNEPLNPYAAPVATPNVVDRTVNPNAIEPVGQGLRLANLIIDYIVQFGLGFVVGVATVIFFGQAGIAFLDSIPGRFIGIPILLAYYIVLEATTSRTLGKLITGTKVVSEDGGKPTLGQIVGRSFCRLIPFEAFSFFGTPTRGWHDRFPKTYVIKAR